MCDTRLESQRLANISIFRTFMIDSGIFMAIRLRMGQNGVASYGCDNIQAFGMVRGLNHTPTLENRSVHCLHTFGWLYSKNCLIFTFCPSALAPSIRILCTIRVMERGWGNSLFHFLNSVRRCPSCIINLCICLFSNINIWLHIRHGMCWSSLMPCRSL